MKLCACCERPLAGHGSDHAPVAPRRRIRVRTVAALGAGAVGVGALGYVAATAAHARRHARLLTERLGELALPADGRRFSPSLVEGLPAPARRWLLHAIRPGTPLARTVTLEMRGHMRAAPRGAWMALRATEVLAPPAGFVWRATVQRGPLRIAGEDWYSGGRGGVDFRLFDVVPVARRAGRNVARSARGRLAVETMWTPAALLPGEGVRWEPVDDDEARVTVVIDGEPIKLWVVVAQDGRLRSVSMLRWSDRTDDRRWADIPFGCEVIEEGEFGGFTVPVRARAGWWFGTDRYFEFFRPVVESATYR